MAATEEERQEIVHKVTHVWIILGGLNHMGENVIDCYDSKEKAEAHLIKLQAKEKSSFYDYYDIMKCKLK